VAPLADERTLICSYQNGLGNAEAIAKAVGWHRTVGARVIFGVRLREPGSVTITVIAEPTALGVYVPDAPADRVREIADAMDRAGLPTLFADNITMLLWAKVAYNAALNPLSALLDVPYGTLLETGHTREIIREVVRELYAVAPAMRVALEPPKPQAYVNLLFEKLIPPTAAHYASMREDFLRKRRTEIDALNGAICRYGREHGIPCPTNAVLTRLVHAREHSFGAST
jgi:2-dehydropantoate 2-reductase